MLDFIELEDSSGIIELENGLGFVLLEASTMADVTTSQLLFNGPRHAVYRFTNYTDGSTNETAVLKVDATSAGPLGWAVQGQIAYPGLNLKVEKVQYDVHNMVLRMQWVASAAEDILLMTGFQTLDFERIGGIQNPGTTALPGATGSIQFTTDILEGTTSDLPSYSVVLYLTKGIPQT